MEDEEASIDIQCTSTDDDSDEQSDESAAEQVEVPRDTVH